MTVYRHPSSYRPPLALGGHCFARRGDVVRCLACLCLIPAWAVREGLWGLFTERWCLGEVRALPSGGGQLRLEGVA